ncbi:MAG: nucleotidyltransferase domain-containing protein [Bacteroidia bacterium]
MEDKNYILQLIKKTVQETEPNATLILYGSYARGEERKDSDIDILILIDSDREKITRDEKIKITYPICSIELDTDTIISPVVYTKKGWANHRVTPYYENVNKEGIIL